MRLKTGRWSALALGLAGLLATPPVARADDAALRKAIEANYARYVDGIKQLDCGPQFSLETSDYSHVMQDGSVIWRWRNDYVAREFMKFVEKVPVETVRIDQFKVSHHRVDVEITETTVFLVRNQQTKALHKVSGVSIDWDIWVLTKDGWKVKRETQLAHRESLDDRVLQQPAAQSQPPTVLPQPPAVQPQAPSAQPRVITPGSSPAPNPAIESAPTGSINNVG